jgi:hypothetical protein
VLTSRTGFGLRDGSAQKRLCRNICHLTKAELDGVERFAKKAGLCGGSFPFPCCFLSTGRGYGFAPMRGILLPTVDDGCRNPDFRSGLGWADLVGEPGTCSSGMVSGSLATTGRIEKFGSLADFEGLEISESDADLEKGLAGKGGLLGEMGSSDPLRSLSWTDIPEATAARSTASDGSGRIGLRVRSACVRCVKTGRPNILD